MPLTLSEKAKSVKPSSTLAITAKAKAMKDELNEVIAQKQKDQLADMSIDQLKEIRDSL